MSEYDDDAERLSDECDLCGEPFYRCTCDEDDEFEDAAGLLDDEDDEFKDAADLLDDEDNDL